jgi:hypothetical protein
MVWMRDRLTEEVTSTVREAGEKKHGGPVIEQLAAAVGPPEYLLKPRIPSAQRRLAGGQHRGREAHPDARDEPGPPGWMARVNAY